MKNLYIIGGTMGVGKTTVCRSLQKKLENCVFLDGDWCWDSSPFLVTDETVAVVKDNICHTLNNFLGCSAYKNVLFCWVLHRQEIIDEILNRLDVSDCHVICISLIATREEIEKRLRKDIASGLRTNDVLERSFQRLPLYSELNTIKIDTTEKSIDETVRLIASL